MDFLSLVQPASVVLCFGVAGVLALLAGRNVNEGKKAEKIGDESMTPAFGHAIGRRAIFMGYLQASAATLFFLAGLVLLVGH